MGISLQKKYALSAHKKQKSQKIFKKPCPMHKEHYTSNEVK